MNTNRIPDRIIELTISKVSNELSSSEAEELKLWIANNPSLSDELEDYVTILRKSMNLKKTQQINKENAWEKISASTKQKHPIISVRQILRYAAIVLPIIGLGVILYQNLKVNQDLTDSNIQVITSNLTKNPLLVLSTGETVNLDESQNQVIEEQDGTVISRNDNNQLEYTASSKESNLTNTLIIPRGGSYGIQLADGTKVWINSDSQLKYPSSFGEGERKVELTGEAYFEVVTDAKRPFVVVTNQMEVMAKGTSFNVSAYPSDGQTATTLVEGLVEIKSGSNKPLTLKEGYMATAKIDCPSLSVQKADVNQVKSWVDGFYYFENMPLPELAKRIERWYDVEISLQGEDLEKVMFTGAMEQDKPVDFILSLIKESKSIKYSVNGKKIILKSK